MRLAPCVVLLSLVLGGGAAVAAEQTVAEVGTASAAYSGGARHAIVVRATVDLPNTCWSNPHFVKPRRGARPDADGVVSITVIAESTEGPGSACGMIIQQVRVPALRWTTYPASGLKAVRVIGSRTAVVAPVARAAALN
jgi:hypothetical protein